MESFISHSFHSCKSDLERSVTMLASSSLLSVCQEFISDKSEGLDMLEKRLPSLLWVALQDQTLLDQLQMESENMVALDLRECIPAFRKHKVGLEEFLLVKKEGIMRVGVEKVVVVKRLLIGHGG